MYLNLQSIPQTLQRLTQKYGRNRCGLQCHIATEEIKTKRPQLNLVRKGSLPSLVQP
jgi:hypothetical protein